MKNKDKSRKWMWWILGTIAAMQMYFVRELLAAFALFALAFAAIALVVGSVYMMQKAWEAGVLRVVKSSHPAVQAAKRGVAAIEDMGRRPFRGAASEPAHRVQV